MKILFINHTCGITSTGRICTDLASAYESEGHECAIAYGRGIVPEKFLRFAKRVSTEMDVRKNALSTRIFDDDGFTAKRATRLFMRWAEEYNPDILWLHNLHGYYINVEMLFAWIKSRPKMEAKWTLHDCWAFTGHCTHFILAKCDQWKTRCVKCTQKHEYPSSYFMSRCERNFEMKRRVFCGVENLTIITPSQWLADLVKQSYLNEYPVVVCHNNVNTDSFMPTQSSFREENNLQSKIIILSVANVWTRSKGLEDFIQLSGMLGDDYVVVLVGLSKRQISKLPDRIIGIERTQNVHELAALYSVADIYVSASREETFGMTVVEALACGTESIVYKDTACEEIVRIYGGEAVEQDAASLYSAIVRKTRGNVKL